MTQSRSQSPQKALEERIQNESDVLTREALLVGKKITTLYQTGTPLPKILEMPFVTQESMLMLLDGMQKQKFNLETTPDESPLKQKQMQFITLTLDALNVEFLKRGIQPTGEKPQQYNMKGTTEDLTSSLMAISFMNQSNIIRTKPSKNLTQK